MLVDIVVQVAVVNTKMEQPQPQVLAAVVVVAEEVAQPKVVQVVVA